jgi:hypothetical protein
VRKLTTAFAIASAGALVALSAPTSLASTHAGNASHQATLHAGTHIAAAKGVHPDKKKFKAYAQPTGKYTGKSCDIDLSGIADFTDLTSVSGCGTTVTFSSTFEKRSVPNGWATWSCPPASESCTPNILYSLGATSATVDFGKKVKTGGFELEPDQFQQETVQVDFYSGPNGTGKVVGTITLQPNGSNGALLFGAKAKKGFASAVITDQAGDDFAIAQVRV